MYFNLILIKEFINPEKRYFLHFDECKIHYIRDFDDESKENEETSQTTFLKNGCFQEDGFNEYVFSHQPNRTSYHDNQPTIYHDEFDFWPWAVLSKKSSISKKVIYTRV